MQVTFQIVFGDLFGRALLPVLHSCDGKQSGSHDFPLLLKKSISREKDLTMPFCESAVASGTLSERQLSAVVVVRCLEDAFPTVIQ